jgi:dimethylhistidine N-methyltransferase
MKYHSTSRAALLDVTPDRNQFFQDVIHSLSKTNKELPCKYFYDERGSQLFDEICELDEYYLTRTELQIMQSNAKEIASQIDTKVMLVEYGSGSSIKTRILLDHLHDPVAYVPVDISKEHLQRTADLLTEDYPRIEILPVCADFTKGFSLPKSKRKPSHSAVYFPGSTIGNFLPAKSRELLSQISSLCGEGGGLVIGIDLVKDKKSLEAAYNDRLGVTAEFNRNLLVRMNRELGANFEVDQFRHEARFNATASRIEMYLISDRKQTVTIGEHEFHFRRGEAICTEHSHKYTIPRFAKLASEVGLVLHKSWTDPEELFAVLHLVVERK